MDTGYDLHIDFRVESKGERPRSAIVNTCKAALNERAVNAGKELGEFSEKWFEAPEKINGFGWVWVIGGNFRHKQAGENANV